MSEFNTLTATPEEIQNAQPETATFQITLADGTTDTIQADPVWMAALFKHLRTNGPSSVTLHGILPVGSPESLPSNMHVVEHRGSISPYHWKGWLARKPQE